MAPGDLLMISQVVEGSLLRELINDVHSVRFLCVRRLPI